MVKGEKKAVRENVGWRARVFDRDGGGASSVGAARGLTVGESSTGGPQHALPACTAQLICVDLIQKNPLR